MQAAKTDLPGSDSSSSGGPREQRKKVSKKSRGHDNWLCPACNASNFAKRSVCFRCDAPRDSKSNAPTNDGNAAAPVVASAAATTDVAADSAGNADAVTATSVETAGAAAEPLTAAVGHKVHFRGFSGTAGETARASADQWRDQLLVSIAVAEAKHGYLRAWATAIEARSKELRDAWAAAAALAAPVGNDGTKNSRMHRGAAGTSGAAPANGITVDSGALTSAQAPSTSRLLPSLPPPPPPPSAAVLKVYGRVLALLREADTSGEWPATSATRAKVLATTSSAPTPSALAPSTPEDVAADADTTIVAGADAGTNAAAASTAASVSPSAATTKSVVAANVPQGQGGTFAVGSMPPPLAPPKANERFFDLMEAAFELEKALAPHRPPSSTIAVRSFFV